MQQAVLAQRLVAQVVATLGQRLDQRGQCAEVFPDLAYKILDALGDFSDLANDPNRWMDRWGRLSSWRGWLAFEARCHDAFSYVVGWRFECAGRNARAPAVGVRSRTVARPV